MLILHLFDEDFQYLFTLFTEGDSRFTDQNKPRTAIHYIEAEKTSSNSYVTLAEQAVAVILGSIGVLFAGYPRRRNFR